MLRIRNNRYIVAAAIGMVLVYSAGVASASLADQVLKAGGITLLVSRFGKDINKGLNKAAKIKESKTVATKVLPVLSVGRGTSVGAVQITGSPQQVKKVKAVVQVETKVVGIQVRALIPNDSTNVLKINRVDGVGVSGIVDVKL